MVALHIEILFFMVFFYSRIHGIISLTHNGDGEALQALKNSWKNTPPSWILSNDPCDLQLPWQGVVCFKSRVTELSLVDRGLEGKLGGVIGDLTELKTLDLALNDYLTGPLPPQLGNLSSLKELNLDGCSFTGSIPVELGNLVQLTELDLSHNKLSGRIPSKLFSPIMALETLYLNDNQLNGKIPNTLGLVQSLQYVWLNRNDLSGQIPSTISNLTNLKDLALFQNRLSGSLPDLSKMASLKCLYLNNNSFAAVEAPTWFSMLSSLKSLDMGYGSLQGPVPTKLFSLPRIENVILRNNAFNGTLTISGVNIGSNLTLFDLENNQISSVTFDSNSAILMLAGNPICAKALPNTNYCHPHQELI